MNIHEALKELAEKNKNLHERPMIIDTGNNNYQVSQNIPDGIYYLPIYKAVTVRRSTTPINDGREYVWAQTQDLIRPLPVKADARIISEINNGGWSAEKKYKIIVKTWHEYPNFPGTNFKSRTATIDWE